jgi:predicted metal-dependent hydrolase
VTALRVRRVPFTFEDDVPFQWHPDNPDFGIMANAACVLVTAFEKYIVSAVRQALPRITDPDVAAEAEGFLRQEAQHSRAHRLHMNALVKAYPGLQHTLNTAASRFGALLDKHPLEFHLAYIADLEATFLPIFSLILDHDDALLRPGDDRVASLFLYHIAEEVEHRSTAMVIYRAVVGADRYRLRVLPFVAWHVLAVYGQAVRSFDRHVPLAERKIRARRVAPGRALARELGARVPLVRERIMADGYPTALACVGLPALLTSFYRLVRSELPGHHADRTPTPRFATEWFARYDAGDDVTRWFALHAPPATAPVQAADR